MTGILLRDVEVDGRIVDVEVVAGRVTALRPGIARGRRDAVDGGGGALLPGLHDHHLHLLAMAAADRSLVLTRTLDSISTSHRALPPEQWLRVVGYHEAEHGPLDRVLLDRLAPGRPVRVQHQTGAMWVMNTSALRELGFDANGDGRFIGVDAELRSRLPKETMSFGAIGCRLRSFGVTRVTDATPTENRADLELLAAAVARGELPHRVTAMTGPRATFDVPPGLTAGPVKLVVGDHALPALDDLVATMRTVRAQQRSVAVHAVTRIGLVLAIAAWEEVGAVEGDRLEHGAVVPTELAVLLRRLGVVVVSQPSFVRERGDRYLREVEPDDRPYLYPCASLLAGGIRVAGSTDAPFGDADPWRAMATAANRRTASGAMLGRVERVTPQRALELFLGGITRPESAARRVRVGGDGDLCLLDAPLAVVLGDLSSRHVVGVVEQDRFLSAAR
jgi:predicted amidohydrolase YtcJ